MRNRSRVHMLRVAAARLEAGCANPALIADLRKAADDAEKRRVDGRDGSAAEDKRIERQRTLFGALSPSNATDRLKDRMLQRAYNLLWDGDCAGCDALLEFLPSNDAERMLNAYGDDQDGKAPKSKFYEAEEL